MKIALVSPYDFAYPGGVTMHVTNLKREFLRLGHDVRVIAPCSVHQGFPGDDNLVPVGSSIPVPSGGSIARLNLSLRLGPVVKPILERERFDIIHLHEPLAPALPLAVLRLSTSVNVGTFHAFHGSQRPYLRPYFFSRWLLRRWHRRLHGKIAVSQPARAFVQRFFPGYYNVIPNGIDIHHFAREPRLLKAFGDEKLNILFVGRLEKRKGLRYLLGAYGRLKWQYPNIRLIVVGPGTLDKDSARVISSRGLEDVHFLGQVSYQDLPNYYAAADIFCSPATGKESFGIVLLEAMAAGKPVVATSIEGYASVMSRGIEGFLVLPSDEEALASALARLIEDQALRLKMGSLGRLTAQRYRWERVAAQVLDYYERLLSEVRPRELQAQAV